VTHARVPYAGIATRAVAFTVDIAIVHLIDLVITALLGLTASLVGELRPEWLVAVLVGLGWALSITIYFVLFWSTTGQTPGMRAMRLRVADRRGRPPSLGRSLVRLLGLVLAILPLFAGLLPVLVDDRRRALQDFLAGTVVLYAEDEQAAAAETGERAFA
jgi:uncharacterized RDD family membrane protein YckC